MTEPKIEQMFESSASKLPDINSKPGLSNTIGGSGAKRSNTISRANTLRSAGSRPSGHAAASMGGGGGGGANNTFPMAPHQALEKYRRVLTSYEQDEILQFPHVYFLAPLAKKINASEAKGPNFGFDDDKGRYKCVKNDHIGYRFEILKGLGKGSFGDVVKTYDHKNKMHVALKIIRNEKRFHKQGQIEVKILEQIKRYDRGGSYNVIHIADWFVFRNHLCITFELLHTDLYSALKLDGFKGYPLLKVRRFAANILACLKMLRRQRIIHCDLKPENILLCSKNSEDIKVIDFGSACYDTQRIHSYIQSRFYRSPEVILGTGYGLPIDMWSLACILTELYNGHPLFPGHDEKEQLLLQMEVLGVPPEDLLTRSKRANIFFDSQGSPRYLVDRKGRTRTPGSRSLSRAIGCDDADFLQFLTACLRWDPDARVSPREALNLPFVHGLLSATPGLRATPGMTTPARRSLSEGGAAPVYAANNAASEHPASAAELGSSNTTKNHANSSTVAAEDGADTTAAAAGRVPSLSKAAASASARASLAAATAAAATSSAEVTPARRASRRPSSSATATAATTAAAAAAAAAATATPSSTSAYNSPRLPSISTASGSGSKSKPARRTMAGSADGGVSISALAEAMQAQASIAESPPKDALSKLPKPVSKAAL